MYLTNEDSLLMPSTTFALAKWIWLKQHEGMSGAWDDLTFYTYTALHYFFPSNEIAVH